MGLPLYGGTPSEDSKSSAFPKKLDEINKMYFASLQISCIRMSSDNTLQVITEFSSAPNVQRCRNISIFSSGIPILGNWELHNGFRRIWRCCIRQQIGK